MVYGSGSTVISSTSAYDRSSPLPYTLISNDSTTAAVSVTLTDSSEPPLLEATLTLTLSLDNPRVLQVDVAVTTLQSFAAGLVALDAAWAPPCAIVWYSSGVRQGMAMSPGYILATEQLARFYGIGDGAQGAVEVRAAVPFSLNETLIAQILPLNGAAANASGSYIYAGNNNYGTQSGLGIALFGSVGSTSFWTGDVAGNSVSIPANAAAQTVSFSYYPNDMSFPPSHVRFHAICIFCC